MPTATITYKNSKTLEVLKSLSKYLDYIVSTTVEKQAIAPEITTINGVAMTKQSSAALDNNAISNIVTSNNFDAKELRNKWQRGK